MRAYTDIEQSKKLAEILPIESADMRYHTISHYNPYPCDEIVYTVEFGKASGIDIPCWSLAALLEVIRNNGRYELQMYEGGYYFEANEFMTKSYFDPVDACVEMVLKLHELKLL